MSNASAFPWLYAVEPTSCKISSTRATLRELLPWMITDCPGQHISPLRMTTDFPVLKSRVAATSDPWIFWPAFVWEKAHACSLSLTNKPAGIDSISNMESQRDGDITNGVRFIISICKPKVFCDSTSSGHKLFRPRANRLPHFSLRELNGAWKDVVRHEDTTTQKMSDAICLGESQCDVPWWSLSVAVDVFCPDNCVKGLECLCRKQNCRAKLTDLAC